MPAGDIPARESFAHELVTHLADIGAGRCSITDAGIEAEPNPEHQTILMGLLCLHEELELVRKRRAEAEEALRRANDELEHQVAVRTEALRRTQEQLAHGQKMEAVGRLAGGVAHDFNNLLSVVLSYTELALEELSANDPLRADIEEIAAAGRRANELTRQLLAFSRQQALETKAVSLNEVVTGMDRMMRRIVGADISVTFLPAPDLPRVKADPGQLEQVIMNLIVNARDAMPTGGKLTIETNEVHLDESHAAQRHDVQPGPYVLLAVSDTGMGIGKEMQSRIFEPFFTTKEVGKGTGLGLATVFGIVRQSGGHVSVYSEVGEGTVFKLYFPRVDDASLEAGAPPDSTPGNDLFGTSGTRRGSETILLVEDEEAVRIVVRDVLRRHGYRVLEAPNGGEALLICEQHGAEIHLLLTDLILPHMNGRQLAERVAPLRPAMKVLFMSGYTGESVLQHGILDSGASFLQKPITPDLLTRKVRAVLDAPASRRAGGARQRRRPLAG